jgi:alpha-D-ribose 1-methylphosphonate 5-triphosphate synthase subunit PhnH
VAIDHAGEALVGFEALPFETGAPVVEEAARPAFAVVVPELAEGFLEDIGGVQPLVGVQKKRERALALESEILVAR